MTKKRTRRQHDDIWNLFVQACGGRCCVCGEADSELQRGHIQRHADGGGVDLENLIPICSSCNARHSKTLFTPHTRPSEWKDAFLKLLIAHLGVGITCPPTSGRVHAHPDSVSIENAEVIPLEEVKFQRPQNHHNHQPSNRYWPPPINCCALAAINPL